MRHPPRLLELVVSFYQVIKYCCSLQALSASCVCIQSICNNQTHTYKYNELHSLGKHSSADAPTHTHTQDIETLSGMSLRVCLACRMMERLNCGGPRLLSLLQPSQDIYTHTHIQSYCTHTCAVSVPAEYTCTNFHTRPTPGFD